MWYIHKYNVALAFGGREEGGWWYEVGVPENDWKTPAFTDEEQAYEKCRELNAAERIRAEKEEEYDYTSVLAHMSDHYSYSVSEDSTARPYPESRPHYE
jgi:hypothetical protein